MYFTDTELADHVGHADVIVFDMNGLIIDDEPIQLSATNQALEEYGVEISEQEWIDTCVGHKPYEYLPDLVPTLTDQDALNALVAKKDDIYKNKINGGAIKIVRPAF